MLWYFHDTLMQLFIKRDLHLNWARGGNGADAVGRKEDHRRNSRQGRRGGGRQVVSNRAGPPFPSKALGPPVLLRPPFRGLYHGSHAPRKASLDRHLRPAAPCLIPWGGKPHLTEPRLPSPAVLVLPLLSPGCRQWLLPRCQTFLGSRHCGQTDQSGHNRPWPYMQGEAGIPTGIPTALRAAAPVLRAMPAHQDRAPADVLKHMLTQQAGRAKSPVPKQIPCC